MTDILEQVHRILTNHSGLKGGGVPVAQRQGYGYVCHERVNSMKVLEWVYTGAFLSLFFLVRVFAHMLLCKVVMFNLCMTCL